MKAANEVFHTTREIVSKVGFFARILEVAETVVNRITDDVKKEKGQAAYYLNQLRNNSELGLRYRFAELSSFIPTKIADGMSEAGHDPIRKVVFACLFCDISLTARSHIHIRKTEDLNKLSLKDQKEVSEHALKASEIVAKSKMKYQ